MIETIPYREELKRSKNRHCRDQENIFVIFIVLDQHNKNYLYHSKSKAYLEFNLIYHEAKVMTSTNPVSLVTKKTNCYNVVLKVC